jgi:hypothetical protein
LVLPDTQADPSQKQKSQILANAQETVSFILLYLPIFVKTIIL